MPRIAYVIPTKDRREDLTQLLGSLVKQTQAPDQIIVVDGGDDIVADLCESYVGPPRIDYVRCYPPSLAKQRNAGIARLGAGIEIAGYLDDDLVMEPDATEAMASFWRLAPSNVGGAAFSIINQPQPKAASLILGAIFGNFGSTPPGRVYRSGFSGHIPFVPVTIETEWLYGGATLWRRSVVDQFPYDEWYLGHGYLEDLDFSYRVARGHKLFVVGSARVWHYSRPMSRQRLGAFGEQQVRNRLYFVKKMGGFSPVRVYWGIAGVLVRNALACLTERDQYALARLLGNVRGLSGILRGDWQARGATWKP